MFSRRNITCLLLFLLNLCAYGQRDIFLTQQWFSRINFNPAATGSSNYFDVFLLNRQQWTGFDNAPKTSVLNAHSYFHNIRSGLGLSVVYDRLGVSHKTVDAILAYAYHFNLGDQTLLSLGLAGGVINYSWDPHKNTTDEQNDPEMTGDRTSKLNPDFDAGIELNTYGLTLGASVTHITSSDMENAITGKTSREYYGYARYRWNMSKTFNLSPGIIYRYSNNSNFFDLNVTAFYLKKYWAGVSYRPDNAFAAMLGLEVGIFRIGYSYDRSVGQTASLALNTHEVMLAVRIPQSQSKGSRKTSRFLD